MPFVPFESAVRTAVRWSCEGQNIVNTLWFRHLAEFDMPEGAILADRLNDWANGFLRPQLASTVIFEDVTVYDMRSEDSWVIVDDQNQGSAGTNVGNVLPLNAAMTVTLITARRGRSYRGRNYVSGLVENAASGTLFTVIDTTAVGNAYEELLSSDFTSEGWTLVVASRQPGTPPTILGVTTPVTQIRANRPIRRMGSRTNPV